MELLSPVVMVNVLGEHLAPLLDWLAAQEREPEGVALKLHLYGKAEAKARRKMGHVNLLAADTAAALAWVRETGIWEAECREWS
ncbi:N5-carboxyaminoimidazole ribonucleotide synthase [compost metagenome]